MRDLQVALPQNSAFRWAGRGDDDDCQAEQALHFAIESVQQAGEQVVAMPAPHFHRVEHAHQDRAGARVRDQNYWYFCIAQARVDHAQGGRVLRHRHQGQVWHAHSTLRRFHIDSHSIHQNPVRQDRLRV